MKEFLDIWDNHGRATGQVCDKNFAHQNGLFHPTVHIWFYTFTPALLMQKRGPFKQTYPNLWDVSVAGHVSAGESILEGAVREIKEEIGLNILPSELKLIAVRKNVNEFSNGIKDCEFQHVFLSPLTLQVQELKLQTAEVQAVRLFSFDEINQCMNQNHPDYDIVPADMTYYKFVMDEVLKL